MDQSNENSIAVRVKEGRLSKGYTQQELSDLTGISIRSVQRIENGDVIPREYTLRLLAEQLGLKDITQLNSIQGQQRAASSTLSLSPVDQPAVDATLAPHPPSSGQPPVSHRLNKPRRIILSVGIGLFLILGTAAFIAQSPRFPETAFEAFCLWSVITLVYTVILVAIWK
ncbi:MAG: helix-turn-helix transcriptional regulator [Chitinophagaceae bacterium]|nr:helix-turn-helix transcriptional regulator [Chitinophagaceae bacterium]